MQEHIRRAHPEHYISKLPATEESFQLMINTPPSERPQPVQAASSLGVPGWSYHQQSLSTVVDLLEGYGPDRDAYYGADASSPATPRTIAEANPATAHAAVALAQLHNRGLESEWDSEAVGRSTILHPFSFSIPNSFANWIILRRRTRSRKSIRNSNKPPSISLQYETISRDNLHPPSSHLDQENSYPQCSETHHRVGRRHYLQYSASRLAHGRRRLDKTLESRNMNEQSRRTN